jgi:hypothetical protein
MNCHYENQNEPRCPFVLSSWHKSKNYKGKEEDGMGSQEEQSR